MANKKSRKRPSRKPTDKTIINSGVKAKHSFDLLEMDNGHLTLTVDSQVIYDGDSWTEAVAATRNAVITTAYQETGDEGFNPNPLFDILADSADMDDDDLDAFSEDQRQTG